MSVNQGKGTSVPEKVEKEGIHQGLTNCAYSDGKETADLVDAIYTSLLYPTINTPTQITATSKTLIDTGIELSNSGLQVTNHFLGGAPTSICHFFCLFVCLSIHPSIVHCAAYLRNYTSSDHNFWYTYVK